MDDPLSPEQRSAHMRRIRGSGNRSTEVRVAARLVRAQIRGWKRDAKAVVGRPDFWFPQEQVAIFVDGCFWHGCPVCNRKTPHTRSDFWRGKIEKNQIRDQVVNEQLATLGIHVIRIWEHSVSQPDWLEGLRVLLNDARNKDEAPYLTAHAPAMPSAAPALQATRRALS